MADGGLPLTSEPTQEETEKFVTPYSAPVGAAWPPVEIRDREKTDEQVKGRIAVLQIRPSPDAAPTLEFGVPMTGHHRVDAERLRVLALSVGFALQHKEQ